MSTSHCYDLPDGGFYYGELNDAGLPESLNASGNWENGQRYIGQWKDGKVSGVGTMFMPDGKEIYGYWWEGELIYEFVKTSNQPVSVPSYQQSHMAALLIANNDYPQRPLRNCVSDARAIAQKLRSIGVNVTLVENANKSDMLDAIHKFGNKCEQYDHAFFFYSGHGSTNQGRHYISSIDESTDPSPMLSLEKIDEYLSDCSFKDIIIVSDACCVIQNTEGNAEPPVNKGKTLMAFSTSLGQYSYDGRDHSPFTIGLLEYIDKPMEVVQMFREVNRFTTAVAEREIGIMQMPTLLISPLFPTDLRIRLN